MPDSLKLFICYRSSDSPKVDKIARDLSLLKHDDGTPRYTTWQDKHNLPPATPHWWDAIVDAIIDCQVFVFHISQDSLQSVVCQAELDYAHRLNRPIIPIVLEGEFFLNTLSGKYDLSQDIWALMPGWLGERQFLFYTGDDFYRQFEMAMDVFRRNWPRAIIAPRPLNPDLNDRATNHTRYAQASDFAERMAFAEAEKLFDELVQRNDSVYGAVAAEWLELLRLYAELIEVDRLPRSTSKLKSLWKHYLTLFPKDFLEGLFDPMGFADKMAEITLEHYFRRAYDAYIQGDTDRALKDYTEAIRLNPQYAAAYYNRGLCHKVIGNYDQAIANYSEVIRLNPHLAVAYNNRGTSYKATGEYNQATRDYSEAIRLNPQFATAYVNRGSSYAAIGEHELAIEDCTEAIRLNPQLATAYYNRAISLYARGDMDQAIADYTEAIRLNPQLAVAYYNRGIAYNDQGNNYDQAIADYSETIRLSPEYADAYNNRGVSHTARDDDDHAIADYSEAIRLNPQLAAAYVNRGRSYRAKGEIDWAIADYDRALEIDPQHHLADDYYQKVKAQMLRLRTHLADVMNVKLDDFASLRDSGVVEMAKHYNITLPRAATDRIVLEEVLTHQIFEITQFPALIGRSDLNINPQVDLDVLDPRKNISRRHAQITRDEDYIYIQHLSQRSKLEVNGQSIDPGQTYVISNGDRLRLGTIDSITLEVKIEQAAPLQ
jgi:tetratricopeptide (TPR) repeat protein